MRTELVTTVPEGPEAQEKIRSELRERIEALNGVDENVARAIVTDAVKAGLSRLAIETLLGPLARKLGVKEAYTRKFWTEVEDEIKAEAAALEEAKRGPGIRSLGKRGGPVHIIRQGSVVADLRHPAANMIKMWRGSGLGKAG